MRTSRAPIASAVIAALVGCSSPPSIPLEVLGAEYGRATCAALHSCYDDTVLELFTGEPVAGCDDRVAGRFDNGLLPRYQAAIDMGRMTYDASQARACIDSIAGEGCAAVSSRTTAACDNLFIGYVAAGGACAIDEECSGDSYCNTNSACPGTCQARGGSGASCTANAACQSGLVCASGACAAPGGAGAPCQTDGVVTCGGGLICIGSFDPGPGTCRTTASVLAAASGAECDITRAQLCMNGLACTTMGSATVCAPDGIAPGAACHAAFPDACQSGYYCSGTGMGDIDGSCAALPTAGMPCAAVFLGPITCAQGATCERGMCVTIQANGGACTTNDDCLGRQCNSGVCRAPTYCP